jgi:hypothetical protein
MAGRGLRHIPRTILEPLIPLRRPRLEDASHRSTLRSELVSVDRDETTCADTQAVIRRVANYSGVAVSSGFRTDADESTSAAMSPAHDDVTSPRADPRARQAGYYVGRRIDATSEVKSASALQQSVVQLLIASCPQTRSGASTLTRRGRFVPNVVWMTWSDSTSCADSRCPPENGRGVSSSARAQSR